MSEILKVLRESFTARIVFWLVALLFSGFYGWFHVTIFMGGKEDTYCSDRQKDKDKGKQRHWSWWFHQVFVNFFGSLTGWAAAYYLIFCRIPKTENHLIDAFFLLVALVGVFGYLPWRLFNAPLK